MPDGPLTPRPYLLHNRIQPYEWGGRGKGAYIPRLLGFEPEPGRAYAELWIGAHPSAPSDMELAGARLPLPALVARQPEAVLGPEVARAFGALPFLLKVLSAAQPLSIQVHPNRAQAERLHARDPEHYPDANHKPEVAIALDGLTALVGFKPFDGIVQALDAYPELAGLAGPELCRALGMARQAPYATQQALVRRLCGAPLAGDGLDAALDGLERRLTALTRPLLQEEALFLDLRRAYPGPDMGLFLLFLLNLVHLRAGQAIYIAAGVPHAYVHGNIVECMAASDNVVRVGLTGKFRDVPALAEVLACDLGAPALLDGPPGAAEVVYRTPAAEFEITRWELVAGAERREATHGRLQVLLVTAGEIRLGWAEQGSLPLRQGQAALIPACLAAYRLTAVEAAQMFRVAVP
ncbi:MAG TPA: mannose-6-phosphate isomerase, class I [Anaerolineae bacterium]|nr:mannose-6-phosphate isomerase, class I [Anaerolineae bacterium]HOQ97600.1 mannose-6-phosphate isomerase, class I [Anaerolineae bacterium]HPL27391.1 mannose-6-phosphate isomerase, class I [Anaerolineae bacterium]